MSGPELLVILLVFVIVIIVFVILTRWLFRINDIVENLQKQTKELQEIKDTLRKQLYK